MSAFDRTIKALRDVALYSLEQQTKDDAYVAIAVLDAAGKVDRGTSLVLMDGFKEEDQINRVKWDNSTRKIFNAVRALLSALPDEGGKP